jgi:hypothetical protein
MATATTSDVRIARKDVAVAQTKKSYAAPAGSKVPGVKVVKDDSTANVPASAFTPTKASGPKAPVNSDAPGEHGNVIVYGHVERPGHDREAGTDARPNTEWSVDPERGNIDR